MTEQQFEQILAWLSAQEPGVLLLTLGCAAALEYIFPPMPGDAITLVGIFLAAGAGLHPLPVYVALTLGAVAGAWVPYTVGRHLNGKPDALPRWLGGKRGAKLVARATHRFAKHGAAFLALNRFLPALRGVLFLAAGLARFRPARVLLWGSLSALVWNLLLVLAGFVLGVHWRMLKSGLETYSLVVSLVLLAIIGLFLARWWRRR